MLIIGNSYKDLSDKVSKYYENKHRFENALGNP